MTVGIQAPDTGNYLIGKGIVLLKPEGDDAYYMVGNVPELDITPDVETLEHFSSMGGTKEKDEVIVLTKSGTVRMVMEEMIAKNIALLMLGDVTEDQYGAGTASIALFSRSSITTAFQFYATNDKGPRWFFDLPKVIWNPSGAFSPISDEYAKMEATGEWAALDGDFGTATLLGAAGTEAPDNVLLPNVTGIPEVDETLTVHRGAWVGASSFSYLWKADGGAAAATATNSTYVVAAGDIGKGMTCIVTATNAIGSTPATSSPVTADVT